MRLLARTFCALFLVLVLVMAAVYVYLRQSLPTTNGETSVAGLGYKVDVVRDGYGIPHIYAANLNDAAYAMGYVHAQDRLWQMEINRRIGSGRLAEVLGPAALDTDRFLRTIGVRRSAEANLAILDATTSGLLTAYAAGVNTFMATSPVLPVEFLLTGAR